LIGGRVGVFVRRGRKGKLGRRQDSEKAGQDEMRENLESKSVIFLLHLSTGEWHRTEKRLAGPSSGESVKKGCRKQNDNVKDCGA